MITELKPLSAIPLNLLHSIDVRGWELMLVYLERYDFAGMCAVIRSLESTKEVQPSDCSTMYEILDCICHADNYWFAPLDAPPRIKWVKELIQHYGNTKIIFKESN